MPPARQTFGIVLALAGLVVVILAVGTWQPCFAGAPRCVYIASGPNTTFVSWVWLAAIIGAIVLVVRFRSAAAIAAVVVLAAVNPFTEYLVLNEIFPTHDEPMGYALLQGVAFLACGSALAMGSRTPRHPSPRENQPIAALDGVE